MISRSSALARLLALVFAALALASAGASAQTFNAQQQAEIRAVVRDYLVNNPDVLQDALNALEARKRAERLHRMVSDNRDFSIGPANAPVTIVEFFDYRCPFCQAALPWVVDTVNRRRDVRFIFKELPLDIHADQGAIEASQASLAAQPQGHYLAFHRALLGASGSLTSERIDQIARSVGIDVAAMRRRMNDQTIIRHLGDTRALAVDTGAEATPTWFVNGTMYSGFRDAASMNEAVAQAKRQGGNAGRAAR